MKIEKIKIDELKPYKNNAKLHTERQIEQIKESIEKFGNNDPIAIWGKDNIIVEGHGRLEALKQLGYDEVEVIRLDHLTDEERRAYTLVHNKLTMNTDFDDSILNLELEDIKDIDMSDFDLEIQEQLEEDDFKENERERTNQAYNLEIYDETQTEGFYQMPIIQNDNYIPKDIIGFNYAKTSQNKDVGIHFYIDDYQFERLWNSPEEYIDILSEYDCIFSPDFSLYMDMPRAMKIWNIYRSRMIGQFYQNYGIKVIPTISWAEKETFEFCFDGIPKGSIVSISTIGVKRSKEAMQIWKDGVDEMIKRIQPSAILIYGGKVDYDYGDIKVIYFENKVTERMKEMKEDET